MVVCARAQFEKQDIINSLLSANVDERRMTMGKFLRHRTTVVSALMEVLKRDWEKKYYGSARIAIDMLAALRAGEAIPVLVENIDWELPSSEMPVGGGSRLDRFRCMVALCAFGGRQVREAVIEAIEVRARNPMALNLIALVLSEIEDPKVAKMLVDGAMSRRSDEKKDAYRQVLRCLDQLSGSADIDECRTKHVDGSKPASPGSGKGQPQQ